MIPFTSDRQRNWLVLVPWQVPWPVSLQGRSSAMNLLPRAVPAVSDDLDIPPLMLRIFYRSRKVSKEINTMQLSAARIGNVCLPFYWKPDDPDYKNPQLEAIFSTAIAMLPTFWLLLTTIIHKKTIDIHREAGDWMCSLCLVPTPKPEAVLTEPLRNLLKHELLADLLQHEQHRRVMAVGSALFQLLAVQCILGEELSLDSSILNDLALGDVVPRSSDRPEALAAMFAVIPLSAAHSGKWAAHMQQFNSAHSFYDPDFCPPTFRRLTGPQVETEPVPQGAGNEIEQQPARWMKKSAPQAGWFDYKSGSSHEVQEKV
ncbi:hypothetical protein DFH08DRAFT_797042 [Mycena albidolilacea]|uniref:Uncharacterized protein n=1 Tax=Mycena albidolilacea TaxID=1033008 RepID=A0AAD7F4K3_9AGAR|nr:hypothetical protein DFH08DRAFT_797042 [Mycena albidolilacea]